MLRSTFIPHTGSVDPRRAVSQTVALGLLDDHARHCVIGGEPGLWPERTEELMAAVGRLLRRG